MSFFSSIPGWEWFDIFFNFAVLVALCGEAEWALKRLIPKAHGQVPSAEWKRKKLKKKFESLLILGIAGEVACLPFSLKESADSNRLAAQANERAANTESNDLVLKAAVQWRKINPEQTAILVKELKPMTLANTNLRKHVAVRIDDEDPEEQEYALEIFSVLKECGFDMQFANNAGSVHPRPPIILGVVLQIKSLVVPPTPFLPNLKIAPAFNAAKIPFAVSEDSTLEGGDMVIRVGRKPEHF